MPETSRSSQFDRALSLAIDQGPLSVVITDLDGRIQYVNQRFTEVTGYTAAEAIGARPSLLKSGLTPAATYQALWAAVSRGEKWSGELQNRRKNGEVYWDRVVVTPIRGDAGAVTHLLGMQEDLSERRRAEQELYERDQRFRELADNVREVFWVMEGAYERTLYISPAYEQLWGRTCQSLYDDPSSFLAPVPAEDREALAADAEALKRGETTGDVEFRVVHPNGDTRWILAHATAILDASGALHRITGVAMDITERKRAEAALRASEQRFLALLETVNLLVLMLDADGTVEYVNPFLLSQMGYSREDVVGKNWFRFLPEARLPVLRQAFADLLASEAHPHHAHAVVARDGTERQVSWHSTVLRDAAGRPTGTLSIGEDVTEHARLEGQLRQSQKMEAVGQLAGGVAHDFNNVLTVIMSYAEMLRDDFTIGDPRISDAEQIIGAVKRANGLTRQLLAFSRQQVLKPAVLDPNGIIAGLDKMLSRLVREDIVLDLQLGTDVGLVRVDPGQLEQVVLNLAVNAHDAMATGGRLTIRTSAIDADAAAATTQGLAAAGRYVVIAVADTGTGMTPEVRSRIFEPFFTTKETGRGTGLGLATVYGIVRQSGGHIAVTSTPGAGTEFCIYLPATDDRASAAPAPDDPSAGGSETILVTEDDAAVRSATVEILQRRGYTVLAARHGAEALERTAAHGGAIQLVITDVVMPVMDGPTLVEQLRLRHPEVRVLYISGYAGADIIRRGVLSSGAPFLEKPFTAASLARAVRAALDSPGT